MSVAAQESDDGSMLALYRAALALRSESTALRNGSFRWESSPPGALLFIRESGDSVACIVNVDAESLSLPEGRLLLATAPLTDGRLPRDAAAWVRLPT